MIKCYSNGKYGHYAVDYCKKKWDEEENLTFTQDQETALILAEKMLNKEKVMANLLTKGEDRVETNMWFLDNRASNHITRDWKKFKELDEKLTKNVKFGDGSIVLIQGKWSILFQCKNGDQRLLTKVYYISNLKSNIINLGQIRKKEA